MFFGDLRPLAARCGKAGKAVAFLRTLPSRNRAEVLFSAAALMPSAGIVLA
jgi:hypothetical protein